jgi:hypothetical protein
MGGPGGRFARKAPGYPDGRYGPSGENYDGRRGGMMDGRRGDPRGNMPGGMAPRGKR